MAENQKSATRSSGVGAALLGACGLLISAACPVLVGALFEYTENWNPLMLLFAGVYLAGAVVCLFVDPNRRVVPAGAR